MMGLHCPFVTQTPSLRESKRLRTLAAIQDHATALVLERGYEDVTVEDIHQAAGIARRTFFNYVDSKEAAVMGQPPCPPNEEQCEEFLATRHEDLLGDTLDVLFTTTIGMSFSPDNAGELIRRRKLIVQRHPALMMRHFGQSQALCKALEELLLRYLKSHPDQRQLTDTPIQQEASTLMAMVITAYQLGARLWMNSSGITLSSLRYTCHTALTQMTDLQRTAL